MRLYIAGINGMVGSAIAEEANKQGHEVLGKSSKELDLINREAVFAEMKSVKPDALVIAAAKVGGIGANSTFPVDFLSVNLQIQTNLLDAAHAADIERVLFLGSSCIYPKFAPQPIPESALLTGELEPTNEPYAIAKIAGLKLVEAYRKQYGHKWISAMPTNLYGPRDNFDLESAHVLPALIHRFHNAKVNKLAEVAIWGDGTPLREFLHVEDLAKACLKLLAEYDDSVAINLGSSQELSIAELAKTIADVIGYTGKIVLDNSKPNGTPKKLLNSEKINLLGWKAQIDLRNGIEKTYNWFLNNNAKGSV
jgi:GDP-L-fucose synthase